MVLMKCVKRKSLGNDEEGKCCLLCGHSGREPAVLRGVLCEP